MIHSPDGLEGFATAVLRAAGLARRHCGPVAQTFVEADLLGYSTHGLAMLPMFVAALERGDMAREGEPEVLARHRTRALVDGGLLPGPVVLRRAVALALELATTEAVVSVSVRRSANTACLATYLPPVAATGRIALLFVGNPGNAAVAPPGAASGVYGTDPVAACLPTSGDPVLFDFATSATTNRMTERARRAGASLPFDALVDNAGRPSADPSCLNADPPGAIAPLGAAHSGHKGFALALLNEALTGGLAGHGRARAATGERAGSACFVQVIDPAGFAGREAFVAEMDALATAVNDARPVTGTAGARVPGARAFAARRRQCERGIELHPDVSPLLANLSERFGVPLPDQLGAESQERGSSSR
jgi:LDH2 family malate/lactate/ureidoglycolate dehydrogenase